MRRKIKRKKVNITDPYYNSPSVGKFINHIMRQGKKSVAQKVVYKSFDIIKEKTKGNPLELFDKAVRNVLPSLEVRSRRIGGANYQVPVEVRPDRRISLAYRWLIGAARGKKGKPMRQKLAEEIMLAAKNEGDAVKKRENVHRMAEANKAFAHFAW